MRYTLLIYTNEADRPQWGTPEGDAEAKGYNDFHGEVTQRGILRGGEPLLRVAGFLGAFAGMYFTVVLSTDATYREEFAEDIGPDLHQALAMRVLYRMALAAS